MAPSNPTLTEDELEPEEVPNAAAAGPPTGSTDVPLADTRASKDATAEGVAGVDCVTVGESVIAKVPVGVGERAAGVPSGDGVALLVIVAEVLAETLEDVLRVGDCEGGEVPDKVSAGVSAAVTVALPEVVALGLSVLVAVATDEGVDDALVDGEADDVGEPLGMPVVLALVVAVGDPLVDPVELVLAEAVRVAEPDKVVVGVPEIVWLAEGVKALLMLGVCDGHIVENADAATRQ